MNLTQLLLLQNYSETEIFKDGYNLISNFSLIFFQWIKNFDIDIICNVINSKSGNTLNINGHNVEVLNINDNRIQVEIEGRNIISYEFDEVKTKTIEDIVNDYSKNFGIQVVNKSFWNYQVLDIIGNYLISPNVVTSTTDCTCEANEMYCLHQELGYIALGTIFDTNPMLYLSLRRMDLNAIYSTLTRNRLGYFATFHEERGEEKVVENGNQDHDFSATWDQYDILSCETKENVNINQRSTDNHINDNQNSKKLYDLILETGNALDNIDNSHVREPNYYYPNQLLKAVLFNHNRLPTENEFRKIVHFQAIKGVGPVFAKSFLDAGFDRTEEIARLTDSNRILLQNSIPSSRLDNIVHNAKTLHRIYLPSGRSENAVNEWKKIRCKKLLQYMIENTGKRELSITENNIHFNFTRKEFFKDENTLSFVLRNYETIDDRIRRVLEDKILSTYQLLRISPSIYSVPRMLHLTFLELVNRRN